MLGEGYDLPNLKIAALHDQHKSLAITLQFIGRFTRSSSNTPIGDAQQLQTLQMLIFKEVCKSYMHKMQIGI
jgi:superfamily II DNA or RNA helicase